MPCASVNDFFIDWGHEGERSLGPCRVNTSTNYHRRGIGSDLESLRGRIRRSLRTPDSTGHPSPSARRGRDATASVASDLARPPPASNRTWDDEDTRGASRGVYSAASRSTQLINSTLFDVVKGLTDVPYATATVTRGVTETHAH